MSNKLYQQRVRSGRMRSNHQYGMRRDMQGEGIVSYLTDKYTKFKTAVTGRPKVLNDIMISTQGVPVVSISVCRKPITPIFQKILNTVTMGKVQSTMQSMGYDKLFHLYVVFNLKDGRQVMLEKNERVMIKTGISEGSVCTPPLSMLDGKDVKTYIETLESKNIPDIYVYSAFNLNCQHFVRSLLNANGITKYDDFISQNTSVLAPSIIKSVANSVTGLAAKIDVLRKGGSLFTPDVSLEDDINRYGEFYSKAYDMW